jgi:hypothetical protein
MVVDKETHIWNIVSEETYSLLTSSYLCPRGYPLHSLLL